MRLFLIASLMIVAWGPVYAVNKCKGADGRVTYQEVPCASDQTAEVLKNIPQTARPGGVWQFLRQRDDMTGGEVCFAVSPIATIYWGRRYAYSVHLMVQLAVPVGGSYASLTVRSRDENSSFHPRYAGGGIKVGGNEFVPFTRAIESRGLGFEQAVEPTLLAQLGASGDFRLRVRMWPWDTLHDTEPISTSGFAKAAQRAMACANPGG